MLNLCLSWRIILWNQEIVRTNVRMETPLVCQISLEKLCMFGWENIFLLLAINSDLNHITQQISVYMCWRKASNITEIKTHLCLSVFWILWVRLTMSATINYFWRSLIEVRYINLLSFFVERGPALSSDFQTWKARLSNKPLAIQRLYRWFKWESVFFQIRLSYWHNAV